MNKKTHLAWLAVGAVLAACSGKQQSGITPIKSQARNAGEVSGGTDTYTVISAYFLSDDPNRPISVCADISKDFGVPPAEVESTVRWAFHEWSSYIERKDLNYAKGVNSRGIVSNLQPMKLHCQGDEDLRLYLGVSNPEVASFRPRFLNPYAFTAVTEKSKDEWCKGFIWFANTGSMNDQHTVPTWNLSAKVPYGAFKYAMLHEVGHVFGNGHVEGTIMKPTTSMELSEWTNSALAQDDAFYNPPQETDLSIDQGVELVPNLNLSQRFNLAEAYGSTVINGVDTGDNQALARAFEKIYRRKPAGKLTAIAERAELPNHRPHNRPDHVDGGTGVLTITFDEDGQRHQVTITTTAKVDQKDESTPLFDGQWGNHFRTFGASFLGTLQAEGGASFPVLVSYNMRHLLTVIDLQGDGLHHPLFQSAGLLP